MNLTQSGCWRLGKGCWPRSSAYSLEEERRPQPFFRHALHIVARYTLGDSHGKALSRDIYIYISEIPLSVEDERKTRLELRRKKDKGPHTPVHQLQKSDLEFSVLNFSHRVVSRERRVVSRLQVGYDGDLKTERARSVANFQTTLSIVQPL